MHHRAPTIQMVMTSQGCGFTLFESLLAVLLIGIAATAFCSALQAGMAHNQASVYSTQAVTLANDLINEIVAKPIRDAGTPTNFSPGPGADEPSRDYYDNVDDYDGLTEPTGQLRGPDGQLLPAAAAAGFSRTATATYITLPGQDSRYCPAFVRVTVEVKRNDVSLVTLTRVISIEERR